MKDIKYNRVLLKLSGEALCGKQGYGIAIPSVENIAQQIGEARKIGVQMAIVIGGGNIWRGSSQEAQGIERASADYMGMLATLINALALQDVLEKKGIAVRVQTAVEVAKVAEPFIRRRAIRHLEKNRVVIFAGGIGNPYFTTDTTAALRAIEINAQVLLKATQVDGVYSADPRLSPGAHRYSNLTFMSAIQKHLRIMDTTAFSLCMENSLPVIVFNLHKSGNLVRVLKGEKVGTRISN